jgi:hypothetical protein
MRPYLRIEKPCEESLENMHNISGGKFCNLCSKKVYDLTDLNHSEISDIIEQNNGEKFCGILVNKRPQKSFESKIQFSENISSRKTTFTKIAAGVALTASMMNNISAQTKTISKTEVIISQKKVATENQQKEDKTGGDKFITKGKIITSEEGKPIAAQVNLITVNKVYSTETDKDGFYALEIPQELIEEENYLLEFTPHSYDIDRKLSVLNKQELSQNNIIKLIDNGIYKELGEVAIGPPYANENSVVFLHGKRLDYKLYNKSYSLYSRQYNVHYIPKPYTKFFTDNEKVKDIYIVFVK